ncbi:MAG: glyceraldehyde 3-phosphate dehydrogenase NAD-binding domain-containing protein, partial [bacterium]
MARIAINGLGRIGKLLLRALLDQGVQPHEISLLNDAVGDPELHAHLLEFDTVHGRWPAQISFDSDSIRVDDRKIPMLA